MHRTFGALVLVMGFVGCSSSDDGQQTPSGNLTNPTDFVEAFASAICDSLPKCCEAASLPHDVEACRADVRQAYEPFVQAASSPNARWDAVAADACVQQVAAITSQCGDFQVVTICNNVASGTIPPGAACTDSTYCMPAPGGSAYCDQGVCVQLPRGQLGAPCDTVCQKYGQTETCITDHIPGGTECDAASGLYCAMQHMCASLPNIGEPCPAGYCASGAYCDENGTCAAKQAPGESCDWPESCQDGLCTSGTCRPFMTALCG